MPAEQRELAVYDLGLVEYLDGLKLQKAFADARKGGAVRDSLLLLEHSAVLTLGRGAQREHVLASPETLERMGVQLHETDRGGDITYHGPGQVVGYPIVDLAPDRKDVRKYVSDIEEAMIGTAARFGVSTGRIEGWTGVWVGEKGRDARKLGAIGVHISRWITTHGFAFNVATNLDHFGLIVPCGIREAGVTSLAKELGRGPSMRDVRQALAQQFLTRWNMRLVPGRIDQRTISVTVLRKQPEGYEALILKRHPHRGGFWQSVTGTIERNESPLACARRELSEETGLTTEVFSLNYSHSFLFGEPRPDRAPRIFQETAYFTLLEGEPVISLDAREHSDHRWVPVAQAIEEVPSQGLKEALRRTYRLALERDRAA